MKITLQFPQHPDRYAANGVLKKVLDGGVDITYVYTETGELIELPIVLKGIVESPMMPGGKGTVDQIELTYPSVGAMERNIVSDLERIRQVARQIVFQD